MSGLPLFLRPPDAIGRYTCNSVGWVKSSCVMHAYPGFYVVATKGQRCRHDPDAD